MTETETDAPAEAAATTVDSEKAALWKETRELLGLDKPAAAEDAPAGSAAPEADTETTPAAEPVSTDAETEQPGTDDGAQAAAAREARQKPDTTERENKGRIAALQREVDRMKREMAALAQSVATLPPPSAKLKGAAEEYPEIAAPMAEALDEVHAAVTRQQNIVAQQTRISEIEAEMALEQRFPGGFDLVQKDVDAFKAWVEDQPKRFRDAFARNAYSVTDVDGAVELLTAYRAHVTGQAAPPVTGAKAPDPTADRRRRQISGAMSPPRSSAPVVSGIPEDGDKEAIWKAFRARKAF